MMPIGSRKDARKMGLAFSLPWNFAEGCRLDITEPEVSEALSQGLPEVALMRILAQVDGQLRDRADAGPCETLRSSDKERVADHS